MTSPTPVLFIHGLWLHATSWDLWIDLFREAGYAPSAPGWPGDPDTVEEARANPDRIADHGIDDVVGHYAKIIEGLDAKPILVGHSFGGMIAQKLLGQDRAAAAVAIDAAQIKGVLPVPLSALRSALPAFRNPANRHRAVSLTAEQFRYAFGNAIPEEESGALHARWSIPGPGALADHRPRLAGRRRHRARLAEAAFLVTFWRPREGSRDEELARLLALGATTVADRRNPDGTGWVVLADPEGNEFCILRSEAELART